MLHGQIENSRIIPVVTIENASLAVPLADAICAGGMKCIEITLRTAEALSALRLIRDRDDLLMGAGTVLTIDQAKAAVESGARFIVSPGLSLKLVDWCLQQQIPVYPGCATPTDLQHAFEAGIDTVKFFPAEQLGGPATLKTLSSIFKMLKFIPTGGITRSNLDQYLNLEQVVACGGSWMVKSEWIQTHRFDLIREEVARTVDAIRQVHHKKH